MWEGENTYLSLRHSRCRRPVLYLYFYIDTCNAGRSAHSKAFIVLDRPNPLAGVKTEGNIVKKAFESFVGRYPLCIRYGLTAAELARMVHTEEQLRCPLHIVPMEYWRRDMLFTETGRVWIPPSPNLPHFDNTLAYPGAAFFEGTNPMYRRAEVREIRLPLSALRRSMRNNLPI